MDKISIPVIIPPPVMIITTEDSSPETLSTMSTVSNERRIKSTQLQQPPSSSLLGGDLQQFNNMPPPKLNVVKKSRVMVNPGKSMVEWMRFQNDQSSKSQTRLRKIGLDELESHNRAGDVWMALNDRVYDVTDYVNYHPGGVEEIMKGAGIDATTLFNQIHRWVNIEGILKRNLLGYLVRQSTLPLLKELRAQVSSKMNLLIPTTKFSEDDTHLFFEVDSDLDGDMVEECWTVGVLERERLLLKVIIKPPDLWMIHLKLLQTLQDDQINVTFENSFKRLLITLKKPQKDRWKSLGAPLAENNVLLDSRGALEDMYPAKLMGKTLISKNVYLFTVEMSQSAVIGVPVGFHLKIGLNGVSRKYTPVSSTLLSNSDSKELEDLNKSSGQKLYFIIKIYPVGEFTSQLDKLPLSDELIAFEIGCSGGSLDPVFFQGVDTLCMIAAGTGITPFIRLIEYFINRRKYIRIKKLILMFFNETVDDIIWNDKWKALAQQEPNWFYFYPVISKEEENWTGLRGRIRSELFEKCVRDSCESSLSINQCNQTESVSKAMVCGSYGFNDTCKQTIRQQNVLRIEDSVGVFVFTG